MNSGRLFLFKGLADVTVWYEICGHWWSILWPRKWCSTIHFSVRQKTRVQTSCLKVRKFFHASIFVLLVPHFAILVMLCSFFQKSRTTPSMNFKHYMNKTQVLDSIVRQGLLIRIQNSVCKQQIQGKIYKYNMHREREIKTKQKKHKSVITDSICQQSSVMWNWNSSDKRFYYPDVSRNPAFSPSAKAL